MQIPFKRDVTYFAKTNYRNKENLFGIKRKDRRQHMYVLGKSGTGKSVLLENMIIQNMMAGDGLCVIDPHGELVETILEMVPENRMDDVVYVDPSDTENHIGFNVLELEDPQYKHLVASGLMGIFTKIWANVWSSRMEYILNNAILALLDTPGSTLLGIPRLLVDKDYRQQVISNLEDPVVRAFWVNEYEAWQERFRNEAIAPIQNKVGQFLSSHIIRNIVGQEKSTMNVFEIMNNKKILLVNVSKGRIGETNSSLLGGMIITKLQLAAMERVRIPEEERQDFYLYVDEFQNFVTESFAGILSEARKYRLNLIMAHQYIGQLELDGDSSVKDAVFGNVGSMIIFRVGAKDAEALETEFDPEFTPQDFVMLPNYHIYLKLMVDGMTTRPFSAKTIAPLSIDKATGMKERIIIHSRELYTKPRKEIEDSIKKWSGMMSSQDGLSDGKVKELKDGKFAVKCSLFDECHNIANVPFKPIEGKPVYCKECIADIKDGKKEPIKDEAQAKRQKQTSFFDLSVLGIEFDHDEEVKKKKENKDRFKKGGKTDYKGKTDFKKVGNTEYKKDFKKDNLKTGDSKTSQTLGGILDNILGGSFSSKATEKKEPILIKKEDSVKLEEKVVETPKKEIKKEDISEQTTTFKKNKFTPSKKDATEKNINALRDVLSRVTRDEDKEEESASKESSTQKEELLIPEVKPENNANDFQDELDKEKQKVKEKFEEDMRRMEGEIDSHKKAAEEKDFELNQIQEKNREEEEKKIKIEEEMLQAKEEVEQHKVFEEPEPESEKEVPEDVLKRLLS